MPKTSSQRPRSREWWSGHLSSREEARSRIAFREVFLLHAPGGGETLRRFGRYMYETLQEPGLRETPGPGVRARVRAVAEDLRFSGQVLADLATEAKSSGLTAEETALAMKAESWAREVSELVRAIDAAVGGPGGER